MPERHPTGNREALSVASRPLPRRKHGSIDNRRGAEHARGDAGKAAYAFELRNNGRQAAPDRAVRAAGVGGSAQRADPTLFEAAQSHTCFHPRSQKERERELHQTPSLTGGRRRHVSLQPGGHADPHQRGRGHSADPQHPLRQCARHELRLREKAGSLPESPAKLSGTFGRRGGPDGSHGSWRQQRLLRCSW